MPEIPRVPTIPNPSTIQARDESVDRARALLEREQNQARDVDAIFRGLGGVADVVRQRYERIAGAEALVASDQAFTNLAVESMVLEREIADSDRPDDAVLSYWENYDQSVNKIMRGLRSREAQRTFQAAANQFKRQRVNYVLNVAEQRTSDIMLDQFNLRLSEMVDAGDVEQIPALFRQFGDYLDSGVYGPGGALDDAIGRAGDRRHELVGKTIFDEQGAGAAAAYFLDPVRSAESSWDQRRARLQMVDAWRKQQDLALVDQRRREMNDLYGELDGMRKQGRQYELTPHLLQRLVDDFLPSYDLEQRHAAVQRLMQATGVAARERRYEELRQQMEGAAAARAQRSQDIRDLAAERREARAAAWQAWQEDQEEIQKSTASFYMTRAAEGLEPDQVPRFEQWVLKYQTMGYLDQEDAEAFLEKARGTQDQHMKIGLDLLEQHFDRLSLNLYAAELGEGAEVVGNTLYYDGRQVNRGALDGARLDVVHPDGRPGVLMLPSELQYLQGEFRKFYRQAVDDTKRVPEDPAQIAMTRLYEWYARVMPGTQRGEVVVPGGVQGPQVWYPGSGLPGDQLYPEDQEAIARFEQRFANLEKYRLGGGENVQFQDAWTAGGMEGKKPDPIRMRWFSDAKAIQMGLDEMRLYQPAEIVTVSAPVFEEMTGEAAMRTAGVMDLPRGAVDEELLSWNQAMQAGDYDLAGRIAARRLPADEGALQQLQDRGLIAAFSMVPGRGAMVKLHPLSDWVPVPTTKPIPRPLTPTGYQAPHPLPRPEPVWQTEESSGAKAVADDEARVDRILGADIESEPPFRLPTLESLRSAWEAGTEVVGHLGEMLRSPGFAQSESSEQFGGQVSEAWRNLWGQKHREAVSATAPEPDTRWLPQNQVPVYGGLYSVEDATEVAMAAVKLWQDGGQPLAVEESAGYLENLSRNARTQLSPTVSREVTAMLVSYSGERRRLSVEDYRPEQATAMSVDPPPIGGVPDAPVGIGYAGIAKRPPRPVIEPGMPGPPIAGFPPLQAGYPVAPAGYGGAAQPGRPAHPQQVGAIAQPGHPGAPTGAASMAQPGRPPSPAAGAAPGQAGYPGAPTGSAPATQPGRPAHPQAGAAPGEAGYPGPPTGSASAAVPARPAHPQQTGGAPGQPAVAGRPGEAPGATVEPGTPAHPQAGAAAAEPGYPGPPAGSAVVTMPGMPADPSIAWDAPPAFQQIGVDTGGMELYVMVEPAVPPHPEMGGVAAQPGYPGVPTSATTTAALPGRPAHPEMSGASPPSPIVGTAPATSFGQQAIPARPGTPSMAMGSMAVPGLPAGIDVKGNPYAEPAVPPHPQVVFRQPVPSGYPGEPTGSGAAAQPGRPAHPQQPGGAPEQQPMLAVPIGVNADGTPVFHVIREPGAPSHPEMTAARPQQSRLDIQPIHSARLTPEGAAEPAPALRPGMEGARPGEPGVALEPTTSAEDQGGVEPPIPPAPDQPGAAADEVDQPRGFQQQRQQYEPRPEDLPGAPEYGSGERFMDRPPWEPSTPPIEVARTLTGEPYPDRSATEPVSPEQRRRNQERRRQEEDAARHRGSGREAGPGLQGAGAPDVHPYIYAMPPAQAPPIQEFLAQVAAADEVEAREAAHRLASNEIYRSARPTDAATVEQALMGRERTGQIAEGAREQGAAAMAAWYLNHRYPDWAWWDEAPAQPDPAPATVRELPAPADWAQNPQMQRLVMQGEGAGPVEDGQLVPYADPGGQLPTIGYGNRWIYGRRENGETYIAGEVTDRTRLPRDLPAGQEAGAPDEVAQTQLELAIEHHYRQLTDALPEDALNWLNDSQLAALTDMLFNRGAGAMTDTDSGRALVQALQSRDLAAINRAWWPTYNESSALAFDTVRGLNNRRAMEASLFFGGWPEQINQTWKGIVPFTDDVIDLRTRALHRGVKPDSGHLVTAGHTRLDELLPMLGDMDIGDRVKAWGMDPFNPMQTYLWITGRNGAVPAHLEGHVEASRRMGPYTVYFLS